MKFNPVRFSSAVGEAWMHASFKVKYCHPVFDNEEVRNAMHGLICEACERYGLRHGKIGFDSEHVHFPLDIDLRSRPEAAKLIKGYTGRKILMQFPELKKSSFWGSGFWNPSYYMDSSRGMESVAKYVSTQKYASCSPYVTGQKSLAAFTA